MKKYRWLLAVGLLVGCQVNDGSDIGTGTYEETAPLPAAGILDLPKEDLVLGEFQVVEGFDGFPGDRTYTLSLEEAADIGGDYLLRMLGKTLDGKVMYLTFNYNPWISQTSWLGQIFDEGTDLTDELRLLHAHASFSLDALTGEPTSLWLMGGLGEGDFSEPGSEELARLKERAAYYGALHFGREIVHLEEGLFGNPPFSWEGSPTVFFFVMEESGGIRDIGIDRTTLGLVSINVPTMLLGESTWVDDGDGA